MLKILNILKFFEIFQYNTDQTKIMVLNIMSLSLLVTKKNSPRRRSMKYLTNEGSPNSVSFTVSEILDPPGFVYIYLYTYIYVLFLYQVDHCAISVYPFSL